MRSDLLSPNPPDIADPLHASTRKMEKYDKAFLVLAHDRSIYHEKRINESTLCGCFHCERTFKPDEVDNWTDENSGKERTSQCPFSGIDSVLGDDFQIYNIEFLSQMKKL